MPIFAATCSLGCGWWKEHGLWALDTSNPNCYDTCHTNILQQSCADMVTTQETRLRTSDAISSAKRRARSVGWNSHFSEARTTEALRGSGGCGVLARKGTGVAPADESMVKQEFTHRISAAWVNAALPGGIYVVSGYLQDTALLNEHNMAVLEEVAALTRSFKAPWIMTGDWNMPPELLQGTS